MRFELWEPKNLSDACSLLAHHGDEAKVIGGGQSLLILMGHGLVSSKYLINIKGLPELSYIKNEEDGMNIGALTTHRQVETSPFVRSKYPILAEMERVLADVQVRNWGTIGGNLCHADPAGDPAPVLLALGAKVKTVSVRGEREMDLEDFFVDLFQTALEPDEILAEIRIPPVPVSAAAVYEKEALRLGDTTIAGVAIMIDLADGLDAVKDVRIVLGAVGPTPIRARKAEGAMKGRKADDSLIDEIAAIAAGEVRPGNDIHGSGVFKRKIVEAKVRQTLKEAIMRATKRCGE
jgi:aerobic carbon-monoxide dehydrogenase medium subunit